jgi:hypothetical protein
MILIAAGLVFLLVLTALGGRLSSIADLSVRHLWLAPLAFLIQAYLIFSPGERGGGLLSGRSVVLVFSYALLLVVVWLNRQLAGVKLIALGLLLNFLVIVLNGGFMPITPEALLRTGYDVNAPELETGYLVGRSKNVVMEAGKARLWFLSDIFVLPRPFPIPAAFSLGDVVIAAGMFFFLWKPMMGKVGVNSG